MTSTPSNTVTAGRTGPKATSGSLNTASIKAEAQAEGREMAIERGVEHVVHNQDGQIGERNTYPRSRDPRRLKG